MWTLIEKGKESTPRYFAGVGVDYKDLFLYIKKDQRNPLTDGRISQVSLVIYEKFDRETNTYNIHLFAQHPDSKPTEGLRHMKIPSAYVIYDHPKLASDALAFLDNVTAGEMMYGWDEDPIVYTDMVQLFMTGQQPDPLAHTLFY